MHELRRVAAHQHRKMVSMSWAQIAEMKKNQGPIERLYFGRIPSPRGGTLVMFVGLAMGVGGLLFLIAGF